MNRSLRAKLLRMFLLLAGTASAALVLTLGLNGWRYANNSPVLIAQSAFLLVVSVLSLAGIAASAFFSSRLRASRALRVLFVFPAIIFPLNDFFPIFAGGELGRHIVPALAMSAIIGAVVAVAIASSWLPALAGSHKDADG